jgi:hypothetical protein
MLMASCLGLLAPPATLASSSSPSSSGSMFGKVAHYGKSLRIIGVIMMAVNVAVCWIKLVPKNQIGGR